jgi:hypothetical protein
MLKLLRKRVESAIVAAADVVLAAVAVAMVAEEEVETIVLKGLVLVLDLDLKGNHVVVIVDLLADLLDVHLILNQKEAIFQDQEKAVDSQLDC